MSRSIEDIDRDIAQVKAEIALKNKYEQGFNQPQTRVGWSSYIAAGDPNVMKMYQDRENAYKNMMKQQEFQAAENELNRQNAVKLAEAQRRAQEMYDRDRLYKEYKDAISMRDALAKSSDPNDFMAQAKIQEYDNKIEFLEGRLGFKEQSRIKKAEEDKKAEENNNIPEASGEAKPSDYRDTQTWKSREEDWKKLMGMKFTDEVKAKMQALIDREDREDVKERMKLDLQKLGKTVEDKEQAELDQLEDDDKKYGALTPKEYKRRAYLRNKLKNRKK